ncbi:hypothetical protein FRX31_029765 [Thalictrum thalictroides]|uniref:Uncharacterized protein n=1 Tax=Thalictrum thalictroides TaxID=46969 RepID=A0A7J6V7L0_THATH|nr:hypothetical protein FRX31_029765 [Thalictrum thalictroides]
MKTKKKSDKLRTKIFGSLLSIDQHRFCGSLGHYVTNQPEALIGSPGIIMAPGLHDLTSPAVPDWTNSSSSLIGSLVFPISNQNTFTGPSNMMTGHSSSATVHNSSRHGYAGPDDLAGPSIYSL